MDFHPLVIHFPIAFLTTYAVFELLRFQKLSDLPYWPNIKASLLFLGEISAVVTLIAALLSDALATETPLNDMYKIFVLVTVIIFGISTLMYVYKKTNPLVLMSLALVGLFFISVAGGLFGATIYGTQFDPYLSPIFKILGVY